MRGPSVDASGSRLSIGALVVAVAAAVVPIVVATSRAVAGRWLAIGDNANFLIRSRDVLTEHHPLLGTWTSASLAIGTNIDNPGPLYFDILALPAKVGGHAGLAVGVAALNVTAVLLIALFAHRSAGRTGAIAAMAMAAALGWSMGSELLFDPWQPHGLLFSVLLFLVLVWAMLGGDAVALPVAVGVGSLIVQTHLSYAVIVPVLGVAGAAGLARRWRAERERPKLARMAVVAVVVAAACWAQPAVEQLTSEGPGNLGKIATSARGSEATVGLPVAVRLVGDILATPPWWARPSFSTAIVAADAAPLREGRPPPTRHLPSTPMAALGLAVVLGASAVLATRFRGAPAGRAGLAGVLIVGLAVGTTAVMPVTRFGVPQHQLRFLWPAGVFITWGLVLAAVQRSRRSHRWPAIAMAGTAVLLGVATLPHWNPRVGPSADVAAIPVVRELISELDVHHIDEPVLFDLTEQRFAEPYTTPVMAELQQQGVDFRVADEGMVGQLGPARRADGTEAIRLFVREGDRARASSTPATRIAFATSMSRQEQAELRLLRRRDSLSSRDRGRLAELEQRWSRFTAGVFIDRVGRA